MIHRLKLASGLLSAICLVSGTCLAQWNTQRCFTVAVGDSIGINDSLLISPSSITVRSILNVNHLYQYSYSPLRHQIYISNPLQGDTALICYRVFQIPEKVLFFQFDSSVRQNPVRPDYAHPEYEKSKHRDWWYHPGMNYSGNFTRGISTGNNQSLLLNSSLNLQLSGDLGDGFTILGAISDNQIPIQPEGNTRQIQEFDRLFLRLSKSNQHLTAGDFEIGKPTGYFLNYYKKNKGGLLETKHQSKSWHLENKAAFAISKGKSNRLSLKTQNGNQGPYRLYGNLNEQFIIILAGSEKVWIDGELLIRGEDADYSMDYNLAEIRFTPKRIISDVSRVIVEFEYLDQNYTRSLGILQSLAQKKNTKIYLNFFNEQDSKEPAVEGDLDSLDKSILAQSGDKLSSAVRSGIQTAGSNFNINRIYYRERDTLITVMGMTRNYKYLVYDPNADSTALQVGFSEVSQGRGQYKLKQSTSNGRVYEWIAPDAITGENLGNYEPIVPLIAPQKHLLMSAGLQWKGLKEADAEVEIAVSTLDKNRLSSLQDDDNTGIAMRIQSALPRLRFLDSFLSFQASVYYEFNQKNFTPINPYRNVEFSRDWNIASQSGTEEHLPQIKLKSQIGKHLLLDYEQNRLIRNGGFEGIKHKVAAVWKDSFTRIQFSYDKLQTNDNTEQTDFVRPGLVLERQFTPNLRIQLSANRDQNKRRTPDNDSLKATSFYFDIFDLKLIKEAKKGISFNLLARHRVDYLPGGKDFISYTTSDEFVLETNLDHKSAGKFQVKFSGKNISYSDSKLNDSLGKIYFLGAFDHQINFLKKFITIKNFYELQSGVEPRQEFVFEERKPGEGNFIYLDFNNDGVRQVYEYVYAPDIDTARFVRFQLFNSEYLQVYQSSWNQFINLDAKNILDSRTDISKFFQGFSFESGFRFSSKVNRDADFGQRINPLIYTKNTSDLISYTSYIQQNLYYNRAHPVYEIQLGFQQNGQQLLLTSGIDVKKLLHKYVKSRVTLFKKFDCTLEIFQKVDEKKSQYYLEQNYSIDGFGIRPGVLYRINPFARINFNLTLRNSEEVTGSLEKADLIESEGGAATFLFSKIGLRFSFKYLSIKYSGQPGSILEYTMLDGFKNGNNYSWDFQIDYKINALIQLQLSYLGRKAASSETLHTGRIQLRANF